jgi:type I restriction enzyme M protein
MTINRITQQQLESYLWGAATLLRGTIDAGDYKQFIFPLLFYKRLCDVFDEETNSALASSGGDQEFAAYPENHRFQIPAEAHWRVVRSVSTNVGQALQSAMRAIETANQDKLFGIFGDAQWTNKDRLSDAMLRDLVEHFSSLELTVANLPEDELGNGYEYLIKKFADDSGHTAAEFYTNRTVVHLMTEILQPQPGESIYDPTCGSGGMLLSAVAHLRRLGKEWRNVRLFGQERNLMTSSIARMNCFLHGIEDFRIERGDTLSDPKLIEDDRLMVFDVVLANPPYSIKQWNRDAFAADPWKRNLFGTPPQGRADYAFWQHIVCSLAPKTGRCAILFPHGVLFRQEEAEMRRKLIEADLIECVLGLGPNLFYNASMEACVVICRTAKTKAHKGRIHFINAVNDVTRERTQSFLTSDHIERIVAAYNAFKDDTGFAKVVTLEEVRKNDASLKIDLYVATPSANNGNGIIKAQTSELPAAFEAWNHSRIQINDALGTLLLGIKALSQKSEKLTLPNIAEIQRRFDRSKWRRVRFGDVVKCLKETVDPNSGELDRYIAGDHMDSENVHLRRWGTVGDGYLGPAFIRRFRKGQVLYGSRRTYLKKVAYAEFDGITANTTFVLEGVEGKVHQPWLPWLMLSQRFTEHSVRESKGSTNPYINFPDIAKFEFDLPPLDQQRRIAEILWALDEARTSTNASLNASFDYRTALLDNSLDSLVEKQIFFRTVRELVANNVIEAPQDGNHGELHPTARDYVSQGVPFIMANDIRDGKLQLDTCKRIPEAVARKLRIGFARSGDVLLTHKGTIGLTAIVPLGVGEFIMLTPQVTYYRVKDDSRLRREFLIALFSSSRFRGILESRAKQSTRDYIGIKAQLELPVVVPTPSEQDRILQELNKIDAASASLKAQKGALTELFSYLVSNLC